MLIQIRSILLAAACLLVFAPASFGATVSWAAWGQTQGRVNPGTETGTLTFGGQTVNVTYTGEIAFSQTGGTGLRNWFLPASSYADGSIVSNAPNDGGIISISGPDTVANVFTFSSPIVNPIFSIVSLGQPGLAMSYNFSATPTLIAGGSNAYWGGQSITVSGNSVMGREGDGTVEFLGTFSTLSFTVTGGEFWNGFTVGALGTGTGTVTPEPRTYLAVLLGLLLVIVACRRENLATIFRR